MSGVNDDAVDAGLILAAEECPPDRFTEFHSFSRYDDEIIRKISAHGPVLVRGGRGSGKSALLLEANRRMKGESGILPVYVSLRYLPLLQSDGSEYISHFCKLLSEAIDKEVRSRKLADSFIVTADQASLQSALAELARNTGRRIVLLLDDAAHIGREKPLEVFFDLFRTLSSNLTSCKASIYPGVTKFGVRFDVYNDSTVVDISRSDTNAVPGFFPDVVRARYPKLALRSSFSEGLTPIQFANLLGRAVVGNLRGFILACNRVASLERVGIPDVTRCFLEMATEHYWPLMEEVAPKLGIYEPLVDPARSVIEKVVDHLASQTRDRQRNIAPDRVLIHRQIVSRYSKVFEILEYLGFVAKREASRAMRSGGRGPVFAMNLCNLLEAIPSKRLTIELIEEWTKGAQEPSEIHVAGNTLQEVALPTLPEEHGLAILEKRVEVLAKSRVYPYGLTQNMIERLVGAGLRTVGTVASSTDDSLDEIEQIGPAKIRRIRDVVYQAIWM